MITDCHAKCPACDESLIAISVPPYGCVVRPRRMTRCSKYKIHHRSKHICRSLGADEKEAVMKFLSGEIV